MRECYDFHRATAPAMRTRVYLDHNATTPPLPAVVDAVVMAFRESFGNPSSIHAEGQRAKALLDDARSAAGRLLHVEPGEIVFTGGGTESDNMAVRGVIDAANGPRRRLIVSAIEHEAVLNTAKALERRGAPVTIVPCDAQGRVLPAALDAVMGPDVALVSIMTANNETGVIEPIDDLAAVAHRHGALFHTDAVQAAAKVPLDLPRLGVDLASITAHKFGGSQRCRAPLGSSRRPNWPRY